MTTLFLTIIGFPIWVIGALVLFHIFRPQNSPADESNRINKVRLIWFALTREELFVSTFPWLKNDELDNLSHFNLNNKKYGYDNMYFCSRNRVNCWVIACHQDDGAYLIAEVVSEDGDLSGKFISTENHCLTEVTYVPS